MREDTTKFCRTKLQVWSDTHIDTQLTRRGWLYSAAGECPSISALDHSGMRSISVGSSSGARELLTRFETGQRCSTFSAAGAVAKKFRNSRVSMIEFPSMTVLCFTIIAWLLMPL